MVDIDYGCDLMKKQNVGEVLEVFLRTIMLIGS